MMELELGILQLAFLCQINMARARICWPLAHYQTIPSMEPVNATLLDYSSQGAKRIGMGKISPPNFVA